MSRRLFRPRRFRPRRLHSEEGSGQEGDSEEGSGQEGDSEEASAKTERFDEGHRDFVTRRRLDAELVRRGLCSSRSDAIDAIEAGRVTVGGARRPSRRDSLLPVNPIRVLGPPPPFVSRGGEKLAAALDHFEIDVRGPRAIDVGASTGGFTDCLLQRGAAHVVSLDVGHGQLHPKIRADARVTVIERTNFREVDPIAIGAPVPIVVVDVSFISLRTICSVLIRCAATGGRIVALVKPQFEAGRVEVSRGKGIIVDPIVHQRVIGEVGDVFMSAGALVVGVVDSPIVGGSGNREFLMAVELP